MRRIWWPLSTARDGRFAPKSTVTQTYDARLEELKAPLLAELHRHLREPFSGPEHPRTRYLEIADTLTDLARSRLVALRDDLRRVTPNILESAAEPLVSQIQSWTGHFTQAAADLFALPTVMVDLPLEIRESRGFSFKWQEDPGLLPVLRIPAAVAVLPRQRAKEVARRSLEAHLGEFVERNVGRLHYHFHESLKGQWRDLWQRIEEVLLSLGRSLEQAAFTLAADDPTTAEGLRALDAVLGEIARIEGMLDNADPPGISVL